MISEPLKGKVHRILIEEQPGWENGFKAKDVATALEWLKKELSIYEWNHRDEIKDTIDEAFVDVVDKERGRFDG